MKQMVSFEKVKLTNNELDQHGHVSFNSVLYIVYKNYGAFMNRSFKKGDNEVGFFLFVFLHNYNPISPMLQLKKDLINCQKYLKFSATNKIMMINRSIIMLQI